MKIHTPFLSPNTDSKIIDVRFLLLHYTGCSLEKTFNIFQNPSKKVSSHFVIDREGTIYEIVPCLHQKPFKAFHAGKSFWIDSQKKKWEEFNAHSLGVELVNNNGNLFPYTKEQYQSLIQLMGHLKDIYPALKSPECILGHEHVAGFRGKVDPGLQFQWLQFFQGAYPSDSQKTKHYPERKGVLPIDLHSRFQDLVDRLNESEKQWDTLNTLLEKQYLHHLQTE